METLRCAKCGTRIGVVRDLRFGLLPSSSVCIACNMPAFYRRPGALVWALPRTRRA